MVRVNYFPIDPADFARLEEARRALTHWRTRVQPFSRQYLAVGDVIKAMNQLAVEVGAPLPFPPLAMHSTPVSGLQTDGKPASGSR